MKSVNMVILMGNMTRDAELRYTPNGKAVASFGLAVNRFFKDASGEKQSAVDFFDIVAWGKLAEIISQYGKKGQGVHVMGRLQNRSWEAQDGSKRNKTEVIASDISLIGAKGDHTDVPASPTEGVDEPAPEETPAKEEEISIDDIPF
ncbi:MAG: single-stranded DNA-binding protein [Patescibacteria group bacterium]